MSLLPQYIYCLGQTGDDGRKDVKIMVPLKYLSNFWRTLEMSLINCEINIFKICSEKCIIVTGDYGDNANNHPKFEVADTNRYVPVVTSFQDNGKLLHQLKAGFKRTSKWNKYKLEPTVKTLNRYLNHLIDPSFQGVNRL